MGGLKPIGSEKLEGMDKIRRIMEIARYNENIPQSVNETKSTEYTVDMADGRTYRIEKERQGYIIKMSINESQADYMDPIQSRKYYSSYSQALKRLNLMAKEINVLHENEEGISLIGEQKKKFILKTKKKKSAEPADETPPPPPVEPAIPPAEPAIPPAPPADMGVPPADMGAEPPMGDMPPMGEEPAMGDMPPMGEEPTMGGEPPMDDMPPMGDEEETETEVDVEEKPKEKKVSDLKRIQILVGKLAQKIRSYEEEKELSNKEVKYIINSILSAIDVDVLDEDDIEQIIDKLEGGNEDEDEEGGNEEEVSFEEEDTEMMPEPPMEPEMAEGYDNIGDAFKDMFGGAYSAMSAKKLTSEDEDEFNDFEEDEYHRERRKGRKNHSNFNTFSHGTFGESSVDKVLSKYFIINEDEEKEYQLKKDRKTSLTYKQNKENIVRLSESAEQLDIALDYIRENPRVKLMGLSTKGNLIFKEGINEVKITNSGRII
jgi:hypothetical protein